MIHPTLIRPLEHYRLYVEFSDGAKGEVDLSDLAGEGVFKAWKDYNVFKRVHISRNRYIRWDEEIELCADSLYLRLTGKTPEELFPKLRRENTYA